MMIQLLEYGKVIWMYGSYIFIFWVGIKLVNFVLDLVKNKLGKLSKITLSNMELNKEIAIVLKETHNDINEHRIETRAANKKITQMIRNTLELSNGGNPVIKKILKRLDKVEETP